MDLAKAISAHQDYKARLGLWVSTGRGAAPDPETCGRDDVCELGRWILGEGEARFGQHLDFRGLKAVHSQFHRTAAAVARLVQEGDRPAAQRMLEERVYALSGEVVLAINRVKRLAGT